MTSDLPDIPFIGRNGAFLVTDDGTPDLSRKQTRAARFRAPSRGVRIDGRAPDQVLAELTAAVLPREEAGVLTDVSAALALGLPLPPWLAGAPTRRTSVAVPAHQHRVQRTGVAGRRLLLPDAHVTQHLGVPVTTAARTWLDCAEVIPVEHLIAMGDAILRGGQARRPDLEAIVRWGSGRRGVRAARRALPLLDPGAESPPESLVRAHLVLARLPRPACNLDIVGDEGWIARVDLAWPAHRLIVEYDGIVHLPDRQRRYDATRRNLLQRAGWQVIVLTADDLRRPWAMVELVRSALLARPAPERAPRER